MSKITPNKGRNGRTESDISRHDVFCNHDHGIFFGLLLLFFVLYTLWGGMIGDGDWADWTLDVRTYVLYERNDGLCMDGGRKEGGQLLFVGYICCRRAFIYLRVLSVLLTPSTVLHHT